MESYHSNCGKSAAVIFRTGHRRRNGPARAGRAPAGNIVEGVYAAFRQPKIRRALLACTHRQGLRRSTPALTTRCDLSASGGGMFDLMIRGGDVVTPEGVVRCDVAVAGETIAAIATPGALPADSAKHLIDATGHIVMPGGIDPHVHLHHGRGVITANRFQAIFGAES